MKAVSLRTFKLFECYGGMSVLAVPGNKSKRSRLIKLEEMICGWLEFFGT